MLFVSSSQTVLRIWDSLFYEGSKVLFRVGVTLIKLNRRQIMKCRNFPEITNVMKDIPKSTNVIKCHEFMQVCGICNQLYLTSWHKYMYNSHDVKKIKMFTKLKFPNFTRRFEAIHIQALLITRHIQCFVCDGLIQIRVLALFLVPYSFYYESFWNINRFPPLFIYNLRTGYIIYRN